MADALTTTAELSSEIEDIIDQGEEFVYIVSAYIELSHQYHDKIEAALKNADKVALIIRDDGEIKKADLEWFRSVKKLKIYKVPRLHSKVYMNENEAVVTSLNLNGQSIAKNYEVGVLLDNDEDAYDDILERVESYMQKKYLWNPNEIKELPSSGVTPDSSSKTAGKKPTRSAKGVKTVSTTKTKPSASKTSRSRTK